MEKNIDKFPWAEIDILIQNAFEEDLSNSGDVTTQWSVPDDVTGEGYFIAKQPGVLAGLLIAERVFDYLDKSLSIQWEKQDGEAVNIGEKFGMIQGKLSSILSGERIALNLMQRLSGIATMTHQYVSAIKGTNVKILDTRKTTPGLRWLEKYAVRMGGGENHRFGLFDMVLIKDNHIDAAGGISQAIENCLNNVDRKKCPIEVETKDLKEVQEALQYPIQRIMLDNMSNTEMKEAVQLINHKVKVEASGNVTLDRIREIAETGVDYISVGALTHSVPAMDISLRFLSANS